MSRLVSAKDMAEAREGLASGQVDIVIGTHALLSKQVKFHNLGLVIVDEEQHFGVAHKEQLKKLRAEVHVLTLTATPIPRTLQLALSGVRELSLIATPPVDRLAVRTYVSPFDPVVLREALLREHFRGGQSFYVVPRIADLSEAEEFLREYVPEVKFITAHGQMAPGDIEDRMTAFYDGKYDVLVSTTIVESGLDIPTANTLVVHRADMFGLAQLYQLRGRVGRSKARAYAYLTVPPHRTLTPGAIARLAWCGLLSGKPRSGYSRRGQSAGRRTVRPYQGSGLRALPGDARGSRGFHARWDGGRRAMVAADQCRYAGSHSRKLRAGSRCPHGSVPASFKCGNAGGNRRLCG
jgi:transcription-repair coupling factor (superfamily II helicase)